MRCSLNDLPVFANVLCEFGVIITAGEERDGRRKPERLAQGGTKAICTEGRTRISGLLLLGATDSGRAISLTKKDSTSTEMRRPALPNWV